jgi:hypothetical protein
MGRDQIVREPLHVRNDDLLVAQTEIVDLRSVPWSPIRGDTHPFSHRNLSCGLAPAAIAPIDGDRDEPAVGRTLFTLPPIPCPLQEANSSGRRRPIKENNLNFGNSALMAA